MVNKWNRLVALWWTVVHSEAITVKDGYTPGLGEKTHSCRVPDNNYWRPLILSISFTFLIFSTRYIEGEAIIL